MLIDSICVESWRTPENDEPVQKYLLRLTCSLLFSPDELSWWELQNCYVCASLTSCQCSRGQLCLLEKDPNFWWRRPQPGFHHGIWCGTQYLWSYTRTFRFRFIWDLSFLNQKQKCIDSDAVVKSEFWIERALTHQRCQFSALVGSKQGPSTWQNMQQVTLSTLFQHQFCMDKQHKS